MQRRTTLAALGSFALAPGAWAQPAYPSAPVKLIVPYAAGGGLDAVTRLLAQGLGERLGQTFVVENRAGAGGMLGADVVAKAVPDGYTLLMAGNPELTITPALTGTAPYVPSRDFTPVVLVAQSPNVFVASAAGGLKSMRAALDAARQKGGTGLTIGTPGNGSPQHIAVEVLRSQSGLDIVHVPYKGAGPATLAALSGEISMALVGAPPTLPHVRSGKLVALAVTQPQRTPLLPDVPTMGQAAGLLTDLDFVTWYGLMAPARTPADVVSKLEKTLVALLVLPDTQARLTTMGTDPVATVGAAFAERLQREAKYYAEVIKRFDIKAG